MSDCILAILITIIGISIILHNYFMHQITKNEIKAMLKKRRVV